MTVKTGVVYLQKDKFQFYLPSIGRVLEFRFVPEIIRDLDVINTELMENLIKIFVTNSKIAPCNLVVVLADNAYFMKDFLPVATQKATVSQQEVEKELLQKQAEEFIEHVPFDNVVSRSLPLKNGLRVYATNKDFYESIVIAFEHLGFTVENVIPGSVLGNGLSLRPVIDPTMAALILQKINTVKQYDLLGQQVFQPQVRQETGEIDEVELERFQAMQIKKPAQKKQYLLLAVIGVVLLILLIVLVQSQLQPPPSKRLGASSSTPAQAPPVAQQSIAFATPTLATTVAIANLPTENLSVQIINASNSASVAQLLLARLDTYKFKSVTTQTQEAIGSGATLVSFSVNTNQLVRAAVLEEVRKLENNVTVQEKQLGTYDITIVLGE